MKWRSKVTWLCGGKPERRRVRMETEGFIRHIHLLTATYTNNNTRTQDKPPRHLIMSVKGGRQDYKTWQNGHPGQRGTQGEAPRPQRHTG